VPGYEILAELGRGGMGVVYRARQLALGRVVALKMILSGAHAGEAELARFKTEAQAVARLQHPNIVQVFEVGEHGGLPFLSLEFCPGASLEKKLNGTPLAPREAAALVETLGRAMQAAHEKEVIHRDLKPANVLLGEDGTPKITDFGLAKKLDEAGQTATGAVMGTPSYMAPEQAGGRSKDVGPHTDVYALGAILYECLTGRPPFRAATSLDTILQAVSDDPAPPTQLNPKVPCDLETICLKCLEKEPAKRYLSAQALADDLRRFLDGAPIRARRTKVLERAVKWVRRHPAPAGLVAVVVLATLVLVAGGGWYNVRLRDALSEARQAKDEADQARLRERQLLEQQLATANRELTRRNLQFLAFAMHAYVDEHDQRLPPAALFAPDGRPLLSWRVLLLPYLGKNGKWLYKQFKLDEAWDGPHNRPLLDSIPDIYTPAMGSVKERDLTYYRVFTGPETPFEGPVGLRMPLDFPDGTVNTFMIVEAGEPVPWTKPEELAYSSRRPLPKLGGLLPDGFHAAFADGWVGFVTKENDEQTIRAYVTPRGGEPLQFKRHNSGGVSLVLGPGDEPPAPLQSVPAKVAAPAKPPEVPRAAPMDSRAKEILVGLARTYVGLKTYRDWAKGQVTHRDGRRKEVTFDFSSSTAFVRPDALRIEYRSKTLVGREEMHEIAWKRGNDVKHWWNRDPGIREPKSLEELLGSLAGGSTFIAHNVPHLLLGTKGIPPYLTELEGARRMEDEKVDDFPCCRVEGKSGVWTVSVWIDARSRLLRRLNLKNAFTRSTTVFHPEADQPVPEELLEFRPPAEKAGR
jgi:hypothetical protein